MKKTVVIVFAIAFLSLGSAALAQKNTDSLQNTGRESVGSTRNIAPDSQPNAVRQSPTPSRLTPATRQIETQNEIRTQNQGEDSQLQLMNQEQANEGESPTLTRTRTNLERTQAVESHMSEVARQVQQIQATRAEQGGIGEQVREIAKNQQQTHTEIKAQLEAVDSRTGLMKGVFGPNYQALKDIRQQMTQNALRIQQLQQIQTELANEGDDADLQLAIQALEAENVALQEKVSTEEQTRSAFGWLFRLFAR